jgi:hypothetical protein
MRKVRSFEDVEPGDCVVGFSRRSLFHFKQQIEEAHKFETKACIVYGGLPPETRKDQASRRRCCCCYKAILLLLLLFLLLLLLLLF